MHPFLAQYLRAAEACSGHLSVRAQSQVVVQQWLINTTIPGVDPADHRRMDFVLRGTSPLEEVQCCDVTLVSPIRKDGTAIFLADEEPGVALARARRRKERTYPELLQSGRARLVVLAAELRGR